MMYRPGKIHALVDELIEVIKRQSLIIGKLNDVVAQQNAVTDFEDEIAAVQEKAAELTRELG